MLDSMPVSRRERNKLRTRSRILQAARDLFMERGVVGTTVDELADAADVSRATFFNYFASKTAVVEAMLLELDNAFFGRLNELLDEDIPVAELLETFFARSAKGIVDSGEFFRVMLAESEKSFQDPDIGSDRYRIMTRAFEKVIEKGIAAGETRTDYPADLLAEIVAGAYVSVLRVWRTDPSYDLVGRLRSTARIMAGLLAPAKPGSRAKP